MGNNFSIFAVSFYKNKFKGNVEVYFEDQIIYLKDDKSLFKLSE